MTGGPGRTTWRGIAAMLVAGLAVGALIGWFFLPKPPKVSRTAPMPKFDAPLVDDAATPEPEPEPVVDSGPTTQVLALYATDTHIYASMKGTGVLRSADGATWEPVRIGLPSPRMVQTLVEVRPTQQTLAAKMMPKPGETPDVEAMKAAMLSLASMKPGLLAGTRDGRVLRLDGDVWTEIAKLGGDGGGVHRLRYHPGVGLAACTGSGLAFSEDGGASWTRITTDRLTRDVLMSIDPATRFVVASFGGGLSRCDAEGRCARMAGSPERVRRITGDAEGYTGLALTDAEGVFTFEKDKPCRRVDNKTLDRSEGWDVVQSGGRTIIAAGPDGLWMRDTPTSTWRSAKGLPPDDAVTAVAVFKRRLYAGTIRYGLFVADPAEFQFEPIEGAVAPE